MHAAFDRPDVVRIGEELIGVRVGVLHRNLDVDAVAFGVRRNDRVQRVFLLVEPFDERDDSAVELVTALARRLAALVAQDNGETAIEEGQLAQPFLQDVPVELGRFEDFGIGLEPLQRPGSLRLFDLLQFLHRDAVLELHLPQPTVALDLRDHPRRERVDHRDADAVEAARHLVAALAELRAGVEDRHDHLDRRNALFGMEVDRYAAAVVLDRARAVGEQNDANVVRVARQRFVHGVVDRLVDELVQAALGGVPDVHAGALAHGVEPA